MHVSLPHVVEFSGGINGEQLLCSRHTGKCCGVIYISTASEDGHPVKYSLIAKLCEVNSKLSQ